MSTASTARNDPGKGRRPLWVYLGLPAAALALAALAWKLTAPGPATAPAPRPSAGEDPAPGSASLEELRRLAADNSRVLAEIAAELRALKELLAREPAAPAHSAEPPVENPSEPLKPTAQSPPLPPSRYPFFDYETLPEEYLPYVGEDELFLLTEDGRLARLSFPEAGFSPRRDLETRKQAEEILRQQMAENRMAAAWIDEAIARGQYTSFDSVETAQKSLSQGRSLTLQAGPDGQGYRVVDMAPLWESAAYKASREKMQQIREDLGIRSVRIFWVDPPAGPSGAEKLPDHPHSPEGTAR